MTRLLCAVGALALVALSGALLAACGGGSEDDPNELLRQTFSGDKKVESGNLSAGLDLRVEGNPQLSRPVSIKLTGPFQTNGRDRLPDFDLNLSFSGGGQSLAAGAVSTGDRGFLEFQNQAYAVPPEIFDQFRKGFEQAQKQEEGRRDQPSLASLGLDPRKWLRNPRVVGDEEVAGTETVHITSGVDVPRFLDDVNTLLKRAGELGVQGSRDVPDEITPQQRRQVERALRSVRFDVWTGKDDKTMRRMTVELGVDSRGQRGNVKVNLQIADLNEEQSIEAPEGARPLSDLQSQLGGLGLGGLGGSGGSGGGSGGSSGGSGGSGGGSGGSGGSAGGSGGSAGGSGGNEQLQAYTQCLQRAGGDAAKAQECADLLTP